MEELGGAHTHMAKSGLAHYVASGEQEAFDHVRDLLSYLPRLRTGRSAALSRSARAGRADRGHPHRRGLELYTPTWTCRTSRTTCTRSSSNT